MSQTQHGPGDIRHYIYMKPCTAEQAAPYAKPDNRSDETGKTPQTPQRQTFIEGYMTPHTAERSASFAKPADRSKETGETAQTPLRQPPITGYYYRTPRTAEHSASSAKPADRNEETGKSESYPIRGKTHSLFGYRSNSPIPGPGPGPDSDQTKGHPAGRERKANNSRVHERRPYRAKENEFARCLTGLVSEEAASERKVSCSNPLPVNCRSGWIPSQGSWSWSRS